MLPTVHFFSQQGVKRKEEIVRLVMQVDLFPLWMENEFMAVWNL